MREFTHTIAAGDTKTINEVGTYFRIVSTTANVGLSSPDGGIRLTNLGNGNGIKEKRFSSLLITNSNASAVTITYQVGISSEYIETPETTANVNVSSGLTYGNTSVGTGGTTVGGSAGQIRVTLRVSTSATGTVTIGTVAGTGISLTAGESIVLDTSQAVALIASTGTITVHHLIETA